MPLLGNKVYVLNKIKKDKKEEGVLFHPLTSEVCQDAEELERKTFLYNRSIWTCKITGQINLTFKEAQKSEQGCTKMLKNSFLKCYECTVLQHVHHSRESLESVIHKSWSQIHEEYSINEPVMIKITSPKQVVLNGIIVKIDRSPPKVNDENESLTVKSNIDASNSDKENIKKKIIPKKKNYHYSVKLLEMDRIVNDIPSETIERTSKPPSKDQIRMFIRAHAIRHSGKKDNPWVVDEDLVKRYKLPNTEPDFICDKSKVKEMSHATEMQMYNKLMNIIPKENGDVTVDLTLSDDDDKKPESNLESSASKKMKQMTLLDMHNASASRQTPKIKSPLTSPSRTIPPLAQQLLRLMKENKDDNMVNHLILKCCQYTDMQIDKFPELIRIPIKDKKEKLEYKRKLKNMTPEEREAFMAERRIELRNMQREKRRVDGLVDDADMDLSGTIVEGSVMVVDPALTQEQWARIASLSEFIRCFKGLLGPVGGNGKDDLVVGDICRALIGSKDCDKELFAELVCLFLKPVLQDGKLKKRTELGVTIGEFPVTACTATELMRLVLPWTDDDEPDHEQDGDQGGEHTLVPVIRVKDNKSANQTHNNSIAAPIVDRLAHCELHSLTTEEKVSALELLQERILELEIISSFIDESQREASEAYKRRLTDMKDLNDRLKENRTAINELTKTIATFDESIALVQAEEDAKIDDDLPTFARRRLSLEMKSKELEDREKRLELDRQMQRLEKEEAAYKRQIEAANQAYNLAINDVKQLMRVRPLGSDRFYRRYWVFKTAPMALYVEHLVDNVTVDVTAAARDGLLVTEWRVINTIEEVDLLIAGLDERGMRENALKKELQSIQPRLKEEMAVLLKEACEPGIEDEDKMDTSTTVAAEESFLINGFKDELQETELNIRQGALGGVEDYDEWNSQLSERTDLAHMKEALITVFLGVHERFWNSPMKSASYRSEYLAAVSDAETQSRLNMLQCFLDVCVCWSKSACDDKCRTCHKSNKEDSMLLCDSCNRAYHMFCLRPPLRKVPEGEWLCPDCKVTPAVKETVNIHTRSHGKVEYEEREQSDDVAEEDSDEEEEEAEEEVCCVCQSAEEGLGKCVACGMLYHAGCHEPPLRHMRRAGWYCSSCRAPDEPVSKKTTGTTKSRLSRVNADNSDPEEAPVPKKTKKTDKRPSTTIANGLRPRKGEDNHDDKRVLRKRSQRRLNGTGDNESDDSESAHASPEKRPVSSRKRTSMAITSEIPSSKRAKPHHEENGEEDVDKCVRTLIKQLTNHRCARPFLDPVDESEVPDYYTIIDNPIDIAAITERHTNGHYSGIEGLRSFVTDVAQIFTNAELYNELETKIVAQAQELEQYFVTVYSKYDYGVDYVRHSAK